MAVAIRIMETIPSTQTTSACAQFCKHKQSATHNHDHRHENKSWTLSINANQYDYANNNHERPCQHAWHADEQPGSTDALE
jgi:hypothetical protein